MRVKVLFVLWMILFGVIYLLYDIEAAAAIVVLSLIYMFTALIAVNLSGRSLKADIICEGSVEKGQKVFLKIRIANGSRLPVSSCMIYVTAENRLTGERRKMSPVCSLRHRGIAEMSLELSDTRCGKEAVCIYSALITDGIGLFSKECSVSSEADVMILPTMEKLDISDEYLNSYNMESYIYSQYKNGGDPGEVFGVRSYHEGDSPKNIHWKLSAKMDEIMVKVPSLPIENNIIVLMDNSLVVQNELDFDQKSRLMDMFFSISITLLGRNISHTLGWYDTNIEKFKMKHVDTLTDMWTAMADAMGAGFAADGITTPYRFIEAMNNQPFTNHFLVTAGEKRDIEILESYGAVRIFRSH